MCLLNGDFECVENGKAMPLGRRISDCQPLALKAPA